SGSRGIGNKIATNYIDLAKSLRHQAGDHLPHPDLAWLDEGTEEFTSYIAHLRWAQHFALLNREEMMDRVNHQLCRWAGDPVRDRKSTRLNSSHVSISYAVFCLKKKNTAKRTVHML